VAQGGRRIARGEDSKSSKALVDVDGAHGQTRRRREEPYPRA